DRADAPLAEALGLLLRERIAGVPVPPSGSAIVELWRSEIEAKAGHSLTALLSQYEDQDLFSRATRQLLRDLDLIPDGELDDSDSEDSEETEDEEPEPGDDSDKNP